MAGIQWCERSTCHCMHGILYVDRDKATAVAKVERLVVQMAAADRKSHPLQVPHCEEYPLEQHCINVDE